MYNTQKVSNKEQTISKCLNCGYVDIFANFLCNLLGFSTLNGKYIQCPKCKSQAIALCE